MRRNEREITDKQLIEKFIAGEKILRVAFYDKGDIYIVPVNYGYTYTNNSYTFYFHGAKAGRKYKLSQCQPYVGLEIDGEYKLLEGETACKYSAVFRSIIGTGKLSLINNKEEKIIGLNAIMKQTTQKSDWSYDNKMLDTVAVFKLDVDKLSCKAH